MTDKLEEYFDRLWPICRSISGDGLRESFRILQELIPLELEEIPTGQEVFDWKIPNEWNIRDAYIITPDGRKICDFKENNLHILNYSAPYQGELTWEELRPHLYTREDLPEAIPYVTSYYKERWGFCLTHRQLLELPMTGKYKIHIDSDLDPGHLTYGHLVLPGASQKEILFSTYLCHPSMANNELSGPLVMAFLYQKIKELPNRRHTYRFVMAPETIGVIAYLAKYGAHMKDRTTAGYVLTCIGTAEPPIYKLSRTENTLADRAALHVLKYAGTPYSSIPFRIGGSDERQYCSPGFDLPVGSLIRSMYHHYPEYHTSLDNKSFVSFEAMLSTIQLYLDIVRAIELNQTFVNTNPFCEAQLGKRGLYPLTGGTAQTDLDHTYKILHTLAFSDGRTDLLTIADKFGRSVLEFEPVVDALVAAGLLRSTDASH